MNDFSSPSTALKQLEWRYATKRFDADKTISDDVLHTLLESLRLSPSSFGLQPWKFIVITDPVLRADLKPHSWDQPQISDCSHLVVQCAKKTVDADYIHAYAEHIASTRGISHADIAEYEEMMVGFVTPKSATDVLNWTKRQVYIAQGFLLSMAAQLAVDACPMEGFSSLEYDKLLGLDQTDYTSTVVTALGYRSADDKYASLAKVRFPAEQIIEMR